MLLKWVKFQCKNSLIRVCVLVQFQGFSRLAIQDTYLEVSPTELSWTYYQVNIHRIKPHKPNFSVPLKFHLNTAKWIRGPTVTHSCAWKLMHQKNISRNNSNYFYLSNRCFWVVSKVLWYNPESCLTNSFLFISTFPKQFPSFLLL